MPPGAVVVSASGNTVGTGAGHSSPWDGAAELRFVFPRVEGDRVVPHPERPPVAALETRTSPTGTSHRVKWRQDGSWQSETFGADRKAQALRFKRDVELAGNRWPEGWIK